MMMTSPVTTSYPHPSSSQSLTRNVEKGAASHAMIKMKTIRRTQDEDGVDDAQNDDDAGDLMMKKGNHLPPSHHHHHPKKMRKTSTSTSSSCSSVSSSTSSFPCFKRRRKETIIPVDEDNDDDGDDDDEDASDADRAKKLIKRQGEKSRKGGLRSLPVKPLTHPLDRSISSAFVITLFFTLLALVSGVPVVLILSLLIPIGIVIKVTSSFYIAYMLTSLSPSVVSSVGASTSHPSSSTTTTTVNYHYQQSSQTFSKSTSRSQHHQRSHHHHRRHHNDNSVNRHSQPVRGRLLQPVIPLTPLESYWMSRSTGVTNNNRHNLSTSLMFFDKTLSVEQLRDVVVSRLLQKEEFSRFSSRIVFRGISRTPFWQRIPMDDRMIKQLIFVDDFVDHHHPVMTEDHLKGHLVRLSCHPLPLKYPLWQIRWLLLPSENKVCLILRMHQVVCDGVGLMSILVSQLADQAPPATTTFIRTCHGTMTATSSMFKPRFGGINFSLNVCRAIVVGPLTFFLWMYWAFTRRKDNFLKSFKSQHEELHEISVKRRDVELVAAGNEVTSSDGKRSQDNSRKEQDDDVNGLRKVTSRSKVKKTSFDGVRSIHWTSIDLPKVYRIKQITRSCLNDVILSAISGALREYLVALGVSNPPDLSATIPVDIRGLNDSDSSSDSMLSEGQPGVSFVLLTTPIPTNTEGSIPRLWEIRHLMEELKASADPAVMYGAHYFLYRLLPSSLARFFLNLIHRNSSLLLSNLQGPSTSITLGTHRLHKLIYFMSPPPNVPITVQVVTYQSKMFLSISTTSILCPSAKTLSRYIHRHVNLMARLLSRRRVPGEVRAKKRPHHVIIEAPIGSGRGYISPIDVSPVAMTTSLSPSSSLSIMKTTTTAAAVAGGPSGVSEVSRAATSPLTISTVSLTDLTERLHSVQEELDRVNECLTEGSPSKALKDSLLDRLDDLKCEFSGLMKQIRRRKSIAEYGPNIVVNLEDEDDFDDDLDGDLRQASSLRRFSLASTTRRSSVVSTAISTAFGASARRVSITPSSLGTHRSTSRPSSSPEPSSPDGCGGSVATSGSGRHPSRSSLPSSSQQPTTSRTSYSKEESLV